MFCCCWPWPHSIRFNRPKSSEMVGNPRRTVNACKCKRVDTCSAGRHTSHTVTHSLHSSAGRGQHPTSQYLGLPLSSGAPTVTCHLHLVALHACALGPGAHSGWARVTGHRWAPHALRKNSQGETSRETKHQGQ